MGNGAPVYRLRSTTRRLKGSVVQYQRPAIVRRERIAAVLAPLSNTDTFTSDVRLKENVVPVAW